jgi:hypothetical protein
MEKKVFWCIESGEGGWGAEASKIPLSYLNFLTFSYHKYRRDGVWARNIFQFLVHSYFSKYFYFIDGYRPPPLVSVLESMGKIPVKIF